MMMTPPIPVSPGWVVAGSVSRKMGWCWTRTLSSLLWLATSSSELLIHHNMDSILRDTTERILKWKEIHPFSVRFRILKIISEWKSTCECFFSVVAAAPFVAVDMLLIIQLLKCSYFSIFIVYIAAATDSDGDSYKSLTTLATELSDLLQENNHTQLPIHCTISVRHTLRYLIFHVCLYYTLCMQRSSRA